MANSSRDGALAAVLGSKLLGSLALGDAVSLAASARPVEVAAGDFLFRRGDPADALYLVEEGLVEAVIDEGAKAEQVLQTFLPGDHFGELGLLTGQPRSASIRALRDSRLLAIDKASFDLLLAKAPGIAVQLSRTLSRHLETTDARLLGVAGRIVAMVVLGNGHLADGLAIAVTGSLSRQLARPAVLVRLGEGESQASGEVCSLADADCAHAPLPGGGLAFTVGETQLSQATNEDLTAALLNLRQRHGHVLVSLSPDTLSRFPELQAKADLAVVVVCPPEQMDEARRLADGLATAGAVRLVVVGDIVDDGHVDPGASHLPPVRVGRQPEQRGGSRSQSNGSQGFREPDVDRLARVLAGATVGLALSGGAAQGVAHLGVMEALLRTGVPVDLIAGTSGGSLYGALVATGMPVAEAQRLVIHHTRRNLIDRADFRFPSQGLIHGASIERMIQDVVGKVAFHRLAIPLYAVATDLNSGEEVVIGDGLVHQAVRASISVPGVFSPYWLNGRLLVDGGVVNPLPVSVARRMGANNVIAVQVPAPGQASSDGQQVSRKLGGRHNIITTVVRSYYFAGDALAHRDAADADVLIRPDVAHFGWRDYRSSPAIIAAGREAGERAIAQIADVLKSRLPGLSVSVGEAMPK